MIWLKKSIIVVGQPYSGGSRERNPKEGGEERRGMENSGKEKRAVAVGVNRPTDWTAEWVLWVTEPM